MDGVKTTTRSSGGLPPHSSVWGAAPSQLCLGGCPLAALSRGLPPHSSVWGAAPSQLCLGGCPLAALSRGLPPHSSVWGAAPSQLCLGGRPSLTKTGHWTLATPSCRLGNPSPMSNRSIACIGSSTMWLSQPCWGLRLHNTHDGGLLWKYITASLDRSWWRTSLPVQSEKR